MTSYALAAQLLCALALGFIASLLIIYNDTEAALLLRSIQFLYYSTAIICAVYSVAAPKTKTA